MTDCNYCSGAGLIQAGSLVTACPKCRGIGLTITPNTIEADTIQSLFRMTGELRAATNQCLGWVFELQAMRKSSEEDSMRGYQIEAEANQLKARLKL